MALHVSDEVVARHDLKGSFTGSNVLKGTRGVILSHSPGDLAIYRVKFQLSGAGVAVMSDLTEYDISKVDPPGPARRHSLPFSAVDMR